MKPGIHTTEFWLTVGTDLAALLTSISGALPDRWAVLLVGAANGLYALSRGWAKSTANGKTPPA